MFLLVYKTESGSVATSGSLLFSSCFTSSSALAVENTHRCQIHVNNVDYLINTKSVILKSLCGSSSFNIYNIWFYTSQEGMFLSHSFSQYCVCVCCRLQQLDRHCQSSAQQVCELLAKQNQLMQERNTLSEEMQNLRIEVHVHTHTGGSVWLTVPLLN